MLELCALMALGYWGVRTGAGPITRTVPELGAPLLAAVLWGTFAAPRAPVTLPFVRFGVKLLVFGSAAMALYATARLALTLTFAALVVANEAASRSLKKVRGEPVSSPPRNAPLNRGEPAALDFPLLASLGRFPPGSRSAR